MISKKRARELSALIQHEWQVPMDLRMLLPQLLKENKRLRTLAIEAHDIAVSETLDQTYSPTGTRRTLDRLKEIRQEIDDDDD